MKVSAKYHKVNLYGCGEMWTLKIRRRKRSNGIQFGQPHTKKNPEFMRSLLENYGFKLVKFEDLPE